MRGPLSLADQIPAAARPHACRVHGAGLHVAPFARPIRVALAAHRQRHLPAQNDVRGFRGMRVIRIGRVRRILPHISLPESLLLKSAREFPFVHDMILSDIRQLPPENGNALPAALGDTAERARPSSGEKAVTNYKFKPLVEAARQQAHRPADLREICAETSAVRPLAPCNPRAR